MRPTWSDVLVVAVVGAAVGLLAWAVPPANAIDVAGYGVLFFGPLYSWHRFYRRPRR